MRNTHSSTNSSIWRPNSTKLSWILLCIGICFLLFNIFFLFDNIFGSSNQELAGSQNGSPTTTNNGNHRHSEDSTNMGTDDPSPQIDEKDAISLVEKVENSNFPVDEDDDDIESDQKEDDENDNISWSSQQTDPNMPTEPIADPDVVVPKASSPLKTFQIIYRPFNIDAGVQLEYLFSFQPYERPSPIIYNAEKQENLKTLFPLKSPTWNHFETYVWDAPDKAGRKNIFIHYSKQAFIATLEGGFVAIHGHLIWELAHKRIYNAFTIPETQQPYQSGLENREAKGFHSLATVALKNGGEYWNFIIEVLPSIMLLLSRLEKEQDVKLLIAEPSRKYISEFLDLMKISRNRVVPYLNQYNYYAKKLYFPTLITNPVPPREQLMMVHKYFVPTPFLKKNRSKIIVISGKDSKSKILNHFSLLKALQSRFHQPDKGWEVEAYNSKVSHVRDNIRLFSQARIIIGPIGSDLSNAIFSSPGTAQIVIHPRGVTTLRHWHMSISMCQPFWMIMADNEGESDVTADINKATSLVESILENQDNDKFTPDIPGCEPYFTKDQK